MIAKHFLFMSSICADFPQRRVFITPAEIWQRKTCKSCSLFANGRCGYCGKEFGLYRVKPKHAACRYYESKNLEL